MPDGATADILKPGQELPDVKLNTANRWNAVRTFSANSNRKIHFLQSMLFAVLIAVISAQSSCRGTTADVTLVSEPAPEASSLGPAFANGPGGNYTRPRLGRSNLCGTQKDLNALREEITSALNASKASTYQNILGPITLVRLLRGLGTEIPEFDLAKAEADINRIRATHHETARSLYLVISLLRLADKGQSSGVVFASAERGLSKAKGSTREVPLSLTSMVDLLAALDKGMTPMEAFAEAKDQIATWQNAADTPSAYTAIADLFYAMCHGAS